MSLRNIITRQLGTGHIPDTKRTHREFDTWGLPWASSGVGEPGAMRKHAEVFDQGAGNSCVGHATMGAMALLQRMNGEYVEPLSWNFIYNIGRLGDGLLKYDRGARIGTTLEQVRRLGVPYERFFPGSVWRINRDPKENDINRHPNWDAISHAYAFRGCDTVGIYDSGQAKVDAFKAAIAARYPVLFGTVIDNRWHTHKAGILDRPTSAKGGGHCVYAIGYNRDDSFLIVNSWGKNRGIEGFYWLSRDYIAWDQTTSAHVFRAA